MKNTLSEILSMMNRIDPTYVSEDGDAGVGDEGQMTQGNMIGFVVDGITFFNGVNIVTTEYNESEHFMEAARLINYLVRSQNVDENALNTVTSVQRPTRGTLLYVIKYIVIGIKGNKTRVELKESANIGSLSLNDFDRQNIQLSTNINNYGDTMKSFLSSLMIDFLIDGYENTDNVTEKYNVFRKGMYELVDVNPDNENEIKFLFTLVREYTNDEKVKKSFSDLIDTLRSVDNSHHREDTTLAFNFLKGCWKNMISFVNEWANKKVGDNTAYVLSDAEKAILFGTDVMKKKDSLLVAIDTCVNRVSGNQGLSPIKNIYDNMREVKQAIEIFYSRWESNPGTAYNKLLQFSRKYTIVENTYVSKIRKGAYVLGRLGKNAESDVLSNLTKSVDDILSILRNLISEADIAIHNGKQTEATIPYGREVIGEIESKLEELANTRVEVQGNIPKIENACDEIYNGLDTKNGEKEDNEGKITLFNIMFTDTDFYYLTRGILGDFFKRIKGLEQELGYNSLRFRKSNISVNNKIYHSALRGMFGTEQYRNLRTYLYYVTNYENYSTNLRGFLYGKNNIYTPAVIGNVSLLAAKTNTYMDDPMGMDNLSSEDMYREIVNMFIKKFDKKERKEQYEIVRSVKTWVNDIRSTGRGMMNSASLYDNIQDTLLFLVKNGDVQDRIRSAGMLERGTMTLLRSLELVFSTMNDEYSIVSRQLSPLDILLNKPINPNNRENVENVAKAFGFTSVDKLREALPLNGLFVFGENGKIVNNATIVDLFAGSHRSFDYEDKDKTNAAINAFCNEVVMNYVTDNMENSGDDKKKYDGIFNQLKFVRELNNKIPSKDLKNLLYHLSIDVGNERFKIAIEYQGEQHFVGEGRQSPLQENIRKDEFQDENRLEAYFERRDAYMKYINEMKRKTVKASLNRLSDNFLLEIVREFKEQISNGNKVDKHGILINEGMESLNAWEKFLGPKNPDSEKILEKDLSFSRIGEVSAANSIARWRAEIDSWHQQLKDNTKIAKLCTTGDNPWMFVQLIPKKYADSYAKIAKIKDKTSNFGELLQKFRDANNGDKLSELDEKEKEKFTRDFTRYAIMLSYYGINGFKYYGYTTGTNKFDVGNFNRNSYGNFYVIPWPTPEGEEMLRQLIIDRYNNEHAYEIAAGGSTNNNPVKNNIVSIDNVSPYSAAAETVPDETIPKKGVTAGIPKEAEASLFESIIRSLFE